MRVWLMKPAADTRYGADKVHSRIGLEQPADVIDDDMDLYEVFRDREREFYDVIIVDEAQFLQPAHVEQLREIVDYYNVPVFCFGLRTDFRTRLFPGSARLFELADSVTELKTVCTCGGKAMVNARIDAEGRVATKAIVRCAINAGRRRRLSRNQRNKAEAEQNALFFVRRIVVLRKNVKFI